MNKNNFRKLKIYQKSIEFSTKICEMGKKFPKDEISGLTSQIRNGAISMPLNIAEGSGNQSKKEIERFLEIALRSSFEVLACLEIAMKLGHCKKEEFDRFISEADEIAAIIVGFSKGFSFDF